jgi:hypothetical protein
MEVTTLKKALCITALFVGALLARPASADTIAPDVTLTSTNTTVTLGDTAYILLTLTNNSGYNIITGGLSIDYVSMSGDSSDTVDSYGMNLYSPSTCPFFLPRLGNLWVIGGFSAEVD